MFVDIESEKLHPKLIDKFIEAYPEDHFMTQIMNHKNGNEYEFTGIKGIYITSLNPEFSLCPLLEMEDIYYKLEIPFYVDKRNRKFKKVIGHNLSECFLLPHSEFEKLTLEEKFELRKKKSKFFTFSGHGVCDSPEQVYQHYKFLEKHPDSFCITMTPMYKNEQPSVGGWRWHKWGEYIGTQKREGYEYLFDEPNIDLVYVYSIQLIKNVEILYTSESGIRLLGDPRQRANTLVDGDNVVLSSINQLVNNPEYKYSVGPHMNPFFYTNEDNLEVILEQLKIYLE